MGYYTYEDRRQVIRYLFYAVFLLILWGLLVADVMYLLGMWDGSPLMYAITMYYLAVVTFCLGPVFIYEVRLWRNAQRKRAELLKRQDGYRRVAIVCYGCGWRRIIGYSGQLGNSRALIHLKPAKSACNVLSAVVLKVPADQPIEKQLSEHPYFRDIGRDAHEIGLIRVLRSYRHMLRHKPCPRCKREGEMQLEAWSVYPDDDMKDLVRHRSWPVINLISDHEAARKKGHTHR